MMHALRHLALLAALLAAALRPADAAAGVTRVELRAGIRVDDGASLTIGDVARVEGPLAPQLIDLVVLTDVRSGLSAVRVDPERIRDAIAEHLPRSRHEIVVAGMPCDVLVMGGRRTPARPDDDRHTSAPAVDQNAPLVERIRTQIRTSLRFDDRELRFGFDERDAAFLEQPLDGISVVLTISGRGDRVPVRASLYKGDVLADEREVRVEVEVLTEVAVALHDLRRGDALTEAAYRVETRWMPAGDTPAAIEDVRGMAVRSMVRSGDVIPAHSVEPPVVIERNDSVTLRSVRGSAQVTITARAMRDGRVGDLVPFRRIAAEDRDARRQVIYARVARKGLAIIAETTQAQTAETPVTDAEPSPAEDLNGLTVGSGTDADSRRGSE